MRELQARHGFRTVLAVPMMREGQPIGAIALLRRWVQPFPEADVNLVQTFADQAVIAIENTRLFNETREALEQQTATSEVLQAISNSVADTAPVFDKILAGCERLFAGNQLVVFLIDDQERLAVGAIRGLDPERIERMRKIFPVPLSGTVSEQAIRERRLVTYADVLHDRDVPEALRRIAGQLGGTYSVAVAPMLWEGKAIGSILVGRAELRAFDDKEQRLLRTFADQAVIAIQNARLFNETQEALEQQTRPPTCCRSSAARSPTRRRCSRRSSTAASACSRPTQLGIFLVGDDGLLHTGAFRGSLDRGREHTIPRAVGETPHRSRDSAPATVLHRRRAREVPGAGAPATRAVADLAGNISAVFAPMLWEGAGIGSIARSASAAEAVHRQGGQPAADLRRPGGDRDPERAPVQRDQGSARAAEGLGGDPERDQRLGGRRQSGVREDPGKLQASVRRRRARHPPRRRRRPAAGRRLRREGARHRGGDVSLPLST